MFVSLIDSARQHMPFSPFNIVINLLSIFLPIRNFPYPYAGVSIRVASLIPFMDIYSPCCFHKGLSVIVKYTLQYLGGSSPTLKISYMAPGDTNIEPEYLVSNDRDMSPILHQQGLLIYIK